MTAVVYRANFATLWLTLQSNETLGILDSDYLEDYDGNDGQVTLRNLDTDSDYPVVMVEQPMVTPLIPYDVFRGQIALAGLPSGNYELRGRCRDQLGNYTIIGSVADPIGGEQVISLPLLILDGAGPITSAGDTGLIIRLGITGPPIERRPANGIIDR